MKIMRYRIRIITLVLVFALLAVALWTAKAAWFPEDAIPEPPEETAQPAVSNVPLASPADSDPWADPVHDTETTPPPAGTAAPDQLFNTFGL